MAKTKSTPKIGIKTLGIGVVIGIVVIIGVLLYLSSHNSLGTISNPYNSSFGYQGAGYYLSHTHKFYAINLSSFNQNPYSTNSSSATQNATGSIVPTTSIYYTTIPYTTTMPQVNYGCSPLPCSSIKNGNFTFVFTLLNGSVEQWHFPITTYNHYLSTPRIDPIIRLNDTITGKTIYTWDYRSSITPSFFANITPELTDGKTAGQFVAEVQNLNSQLVNYSLIFANTSVYPAQLLAQGQGDCKDKGVLMASILEAGNLQANYGMKIEFVYVDAGNLTAPHTADHLLLDITYANGTKAFLDTTHVLATSPYFNGTVDGWYYNLTCTMSGCQTVPLCTGLYCDAVGYVSGGNSSFNTCQSGYIVGSDNLCHFQSGGVDYYYAGGYNYTTLPTTTIPYTTTIYPSGSGSCSSFELTESLPTTETTGTCTWSGGYLTVSDNEGQFTYAIADIYNSTSSYNAYYLNKTVSDSPSCLTDTKSYYFPEGSYTVYIKTGGYGTSCSNNYAYLTLSS
ncbi:MAG: hypothetical protein KGH61_01710 [Candidatus Micrarchaeota archaeon]|nr:hypothetical protein [Candidatus Micrarchaeota archaeon]MDE1847646.1 hypothetical protein [Candidatus Micrarchaeota archaeon]MDE1864467.1 hypothetical protein [Candidatus Micrarchaeota archaeon]